MADSKLTALTALTVPAQADILYIVDDPGGTPLSRKITLQNLRKHLDSEKAIFGTGGDAEVYHDGTNFHIDPEAAGATTAFVVNETGADCDLRIEGLNNTSLFALDAGEDSAVFGGAVVDGATLTLHPGGATRTAVTAVGHGLHVPADTNNFDNASSTVAIGAVVSYGIQTLTGDTATLTFTDAATLYIAGVPAASTNVAITNTALALWVDAGDCRFDGAILAADGTAEAPSVAFNSDADGTGAGLYRVSANVIGVSINGSKEWEFNSGFINANGASGPTVVNEPSSTTNPTIIPDRSETGTGIGGTSNNLSLVGVSKEALRVTNTSDTISVDIFDGDGWTAGLATADDYSLQVAATLNDTTAGSAGETFALYKGAMTATDFAGWDTAGAGDGTGVFLLKLLSGASATKRMMEYEMTSTTSGSLMIESGTQARPGYSFSGDPDTGLYLRGVGIISVGIGNAREFEWQAGRYFADDSAGPVMLNEASSATNPTLVPDRSEEGTGIGGTSDNLALIVGNTGTKVEVTGGIYLASQSATEIGFSVTNGALTVGSLGSVVIPTSGANASDALAGDIDGAIYIDSTGAAERFYFRHGGAWHYVSQTAGFTWPKEERVTFGHRWDVDDLAIMRVDEIQHDGAVHALPFSLDAALLNTKHERRLDQLTQRVEALEEA